MIESIIHSFKRVPIRTTAIIIGSVLLCFIASIADNLVVTGIQPSTQQRHPSIIRSTSSQFVEHQDPMVQFSGWKTAKPYSTNITNTMKLLINSTRNIENIDYNKIYTPKTYNYNIKCDRINLDLTLDNTNQDSKFYLNSEGCVTATVFPLSLNLDNPTSNMSVQQVSSGYWRVAVPVIGNPNIGLPMELPILVLSANDSWRCGASELSPYSAIPVNQLTSYPKTTVTKCVLPSGEVRVTSLSTIKFIAYGNYTNGTDADIASMKKGFQLATRATVNQNQLLQGMYSSINSTNLQRYPMLMIEAMVYNSSAEMLFCNTARWDSNKLPAYSQYLALMCTYATVNIIILEEQQLNPDIAEMRKNQSYPNPPLVSQAMTIVHTLSPSQDTGVATYTAYVMNMTIQASEYLASLGQNFYADYDNSQMYIVYDSEEIVRGFEAPLWLVCFVFVVIVVGLLVWFLTQRSIEGVYGDSLYRIVAREVNSRSKSDEEKVPMLMVSQLNPLKIDGYDIVSNGRAYELEKMELDEVS